MNIRALLLSLCIILPAQAQQLILDEEFSQACQTLTNPLRTSLAPRTNVQFVLVNSPDINAFVTGENIVYVHSGLVLKAKSASELQGVLAHELGHIQGAHIYQGQSNARTASIGSIAGAVLGVGAAVAGAPQVGNALMVGSQAGALTNILAHTRTQEQEADQYAVAALHAAGYSASGMVGMFTTLRNESQLSYNAPPPWLVTHPLPPQRLASLEAIVQSESNLKTPDFAFNRLQAKVAALTSTPASVMRTFPGSTPVDKYARALAIAAQGKLAEAQTTLAPLLKESPTDPFYLELSARLSVEQGKLAEAETTLAKIVAAHPSWLLIRYQYAEVLRALNKPKEALANYQRVTAAWGDWSEAWQGEGISYGTLGRLTESHLALTESYIAAYDKKAAQQSLALAKNYLSKTPNADQQTWADALAHRIERMN